jgi:hypothetical protein
MPKKLDCSVEDSPFEDSSVAAGSGTVIVSGRPAVVQGMNIRVKRRRGAPKKSPEETKPAEVAHYCREHGINATVTKYPKLKLVTILEYDRRFNKK